MSVSRPLPSCVAPWNGIDHLVRARVGVGGRVGVRVRVRVGTASTTA